MQTKRKVMKMEITDFIISQGGYSETMFVISKEGKLWRRKNDSFDCYACYGEVVNATPERREKLLALLRKARPERGIRSFATTKQTAEILKKFNERN